MPNWKYNAIELLSFGLWTALSMCFMAGNRSQMARWPPPERRSEANKKKETLSEIEDVRRICSEEIAILSLNGAKERMMLIFHRDGGHAKPDRTAETKALRGVGRGGLGDPLGRFLTLNS